MWTSYVDVDVLVHVVVDGLLRTPGRRGLRLGRSQGGSSLFGSIVVQNG